MSEPWEDFGATNVVTAPWEDFKGGKLPTPKSPVGDGPWEDFKLSPNANKDGGTNVQLPPNIQLGKQLPDEGQGLPIKNLLPAIGGVLEKVGTSALNVPSEFVHRVLTEAGADVPRFDAPYQPPFAPGREMVDTSGLRQGPKQYDTKGKEIPSDAQKLISGALTPGNALIAALTGGAGTLAKTGLGAAETISPLLNKAVSGYFTGVGGQGAIEAASEGRGADAAANLAVGLAGARGMAHGRGEALRPAREPLQAQGEPLQAPPSKPIEPLKPGGSQASLPTEQQAISKKNNGREAFEALAKEKGVPLPSNESKSVIPRDYQPAIKLGSGEVFVGGTHISMSSKLTYEQQQSGVLRGFLNSEGEFFPSLLDVSRDIESKKAAKQQGTTLPSAMPLDPLQQKFSKKLENEIKFNIESGSENVDESEKISRGDAIRRVMEDMEESDHPASEFKKELQDFGIKTGIYKEYSKEQIDKITTTGGRKYNFKRGDKYYILDTWKSLENKESTKTHAPLDPNVVGPEAKQLKEQRIAELEKSGAKGTAEALKNTSDKQYITPESRSKAILENPNATPLRRIEKTNPQPGESLTMGEEVKNKLAPILNAAKSADIMVNPWDVVYDMMDGGKGEYNGDLMENIRKPLDDDFNEELSIIKLSGDPIRELVKKYKVDTKKSQRIDVYLKSIQQGGVERMVKSGIKQEVINNILKTLTPEEREIGDKLVSIYKETYPIIQRVARNADGVLLHQIENYSPWHRDWGKYKDTPDEIATNPALLTEKAKNEGVDLDDVLWPGLEVELEGRSKPGSIESRNKGAETPIRLDAIATFERYIRDYAHYVTSREHIKEMGKIVRSPEFAEKYGDLGQELILEHLNTVARQGRYKQYRVLGALRRMSSRGILAYNPASQLVHLANVPLAMERAGVEWWSRGMNEAMSDRGQVFLNKHFGETFARGGGEPALAEIAEQHARTKFGKGYNAVSRGGFWVQRQIDMYNSQATSLGIYLKLLKEKGLDYTHYDTVKPDLDAIRQARVLSRRAVASPIYKDTPPVISGGGDIAKSFLQFQNAFLDQWSNIRYDFAQHGISQALAGNPKLAARMAFAIGLMLLTESGVKYGAKKAIQSVTGEKRKDDNEFVKEIEREALHRVPGMGQLTAALIYGETGVPSIDAALQPVKEGIKFANAKDKSGRVLAATRGIGGLLEASGVPAAGIATTIVSSKERAEMFKSHNDRMKEKVGKKVETMGIEDRIKEEYKAAQSRPVLEGEEKARIAEASIKLQDRNRKDLESKLTKPDRDWLKSRGISLAGFGNSITFAKSDVEELGLDKAVSVHFTDKEEAQFKQILVQQYTEDIQTMRKDYDKLPSGEKKAYVQEMVKDATSRAREQMKEGMIKSTTVTGEDQGKLKAFR